MTASTASTASTVQSESAIRQRLATVQEQIGAAARSAGRSPDGVRLVVVTKGQPLHVVESAIRAGARILGENYAEEAAQKIEAVRRGPSSGGLVEWHMIGHVQGRKAKLVAHYFDMIHSLDSVKLAQRLNSLAEELERRLPVLLEFNVGGEPGKHGWAAAETAAWPRLLADVETVANLANLQVRGLMAMPPLASTPEDSRRFFRLLRQLQGYLADKVAAADWAELSMGTSTDFSVAVEEGATLVRVGEALLGPRPSRETA
jgi:pyridoxal phosphate enzyme (YggS family)